MLDGGWSSGSSVITHYDITTQININNFFCSSVFHFYSHQVFRSDVPPDQMHKLQTKLHFAWLSWIRPRTSLPSLITHTQTHTQKEKKNHTPNLVHLHLCLALREYSRAALCNALICHHIRKKKTTQISMHDWPASAEPQASECACVDVHVWWLKPTLTYIWERWQGAAGKWVCGAQAQKTHNTTAGKLRQGSTVAFLCVWPQWWNDSPWVKKPFWEWFRQRC